MKHVAFQTLALAILAFSSLTHAAIVGNESDDTNMEVGESNVNGGPHTSGLPGVGVDSSNYNKNQKVDFAGLESVGSTDPNTDVTTISQPITAPDHEGLGVFHFAEVESSGVWYGEWSETSDVSDGTHSVYYVGEDADTSIASSDEVDYTVKGISDYDNRGVLSGTFTAHFNTNELEGILNNGNGYEVDIGTATINSNDATFSGSSGTASVNSSTVASGGDVDGQFFNSQEQLAGFVEFGNNSQYDTAFGGSQVED